MPLSAITHFSPSTTPLAVNHQGFFPAVTLSFNLAPGVALGDAVANIQAAERQMNMPASIRASFQGTAQAFQASLASQPILILAALVTVYIVLGVLYESFIHPITILSTLPSAGVGAILALLLCGGELNIIAMIGIILLIGIVKKNAIMMIDFALDAQRDQRQGGRGRHLPGLSPALPAHHDDDDGRPPRRLPLALGTRCRRRAAPAARHHHRGRTLGLPAPHPVHYPCRLPLSGAPPDEAGPPAGARPPSGVPAPVTASQGDGRS